MARSSASETIYPVCLVAGPPYVVQAHRCAESRSNRRGSLGCGWLSGGRRDVVVVIAVTVAVDVGSGASTCASLLSVGVYKELFHLEKLVVQNISSLF
ncbi:hypothetical protein Tco_0425544 [Tanacetum coccineum]